VLSLSIVDVKDFMGKLLKSDGFDGFDFHSFCLHNFAVFEISKHPEQSIKTWGTMRPYAFEIVKGVHLPSYMKVVLAQMQDENTMFLNITFDDGKIIITSGMAQRSFSMDKSSYHRWNEHIKDFLQANEILFTNNMEEN